MTETMEIRIERPAFGGAGLARQDGRIVFVDGGLPGSLVEARVTKAEKSCLHAVATRVIEPSPHAVTPFCPHFGVCGGCTWQDASYEAQLAWKREIVQEQLKRLGRIEVEVEPTVASPLQRHYRNKMEFAFASGPRIGLRRRYEPGRIEEVTQCSLMPDTAMRILAVARELAARTTLPPFYAKTGTGVWRHLVLRRSESSGKWLAMFIVGPRSPVGKLQGLGKELMERFPEELTGVVMGIRRDRGDYAIAESRAWTLGDGFLEDEMDGLRFSVSAEAFFQTNTGAAALLYARAVEAARLTGTETVWDLYSGAGGLSLFMARKAQAVTGYEVNNEAVEDARENASANSLLNCAFVPGDLKDSLAREQGAPDVVVLDPPRAGLHPETVDTLLATSAKRMVYVSCNPSTLARDLARLSAAYAVRRVTPVDLFPHTPHVECVAELDRI